MHQELRLIFQAGKLWREEYQQAFATIVLGTCLGLFALKTVAEVHGWSPQ